MVKIQNHFRIPQAQLVLTANAQNNVCSRICSAIAEALKNVKDFFIKMCSCGKKPPAINAQAQVIQNIPVINNNPAINHPLVNNHPPVINNNLPNNNNLPPFPVMQIALPPQEPLVKELREFICTLDIAQVDQEIARFNEQIANAHRVYGIQMRLPLEQRDAQVLRIVQPVLQTAAAFWAALHTRRAHLAALELPPEQMNALRAMNRAQLNHNNIEGVEAKRTCANELIALEEGSAERTEKQAEFDLICVALVALRARLNDIPAIDNHPVNANIPPMPVQFPLPPQIEVPENVRTLFCSLDVAEVDQEIANFNQKLEGDRRLVEEQNRLPLEQRNADNLLDAQVALEIAVDAWRTLHLRKAHLAAIPLPAGDLELNREQLNENILHCQAHMPFNKNEIRRLVEGSAEREQVQARFDLECARMAALQARLEALPEEAPHVQADLNNNNRNELPPLPLQFPLPEQRPLGRNFRDYYCTLDLARLNGEIANFAQAFEREHLAVEAQNGLPLEQRDAQRLNASLEIVQQAQAAWAELHARKAHLEAIPLPEEITAVLPTLDRVQVIERLQIYNDQLIPLVADIRRLDEGTPERAAAQEAFDLVCAIQAATRARFEQFPRDFIDMW